MSFKLSFSKKFNSKIYILDRISAKLILSKDILERINIKKSQITNSTMLSIYNSHQSVKMV